MEESKKLSLKEQLKHNHLEKIQLEKKLEKEQLEKTRINKSYSRGYGHGTFDALIRVGGLYVTYKVCEFLMERLVLFKQPKDKDK